MTQQPTGNPTQARPQPLWPSDQPTNLLPNWTSPDFYGTNLNQYAGWWRQQESAQYWNNPARLSRWYNVIQNMHPNWEPLPVNPSSVSAAYNYMQYVNGGGDPSTWHALPGNDPGQSVFRTMAAPPTDMQLESDQDAMLDDAAKSETPLWDLMSAMQQDPAVIDYNSWLRNNPQVAAQQPTQELPEWQKYIGFAFSNPIINSTVMGAASGFIMGGGVPGAAIGSGFGALLGVAQSPAVVNTLINWIPGFQEDHYRKVLNDAMMLLPANLIQEGLERSLGMGIQTYGALTNPDKYGDIEEIWSNLPAAWRGSANTFGVYGQQLGLGNFAPLLFGEQQAKAGEILVLGQAAPVQSTTPAGLSGLTEMRRLFESGEAYTLAREALGKENVGLDEVYQVLESRYGFSGMVGSTLGMLLTAMPSERIYNFATKSTLNGFAKITKDANFQLAVKQTGGRFTDAVALYRILERQTKSVEQLSDSNFIHRWITGVTSEGQDLIMTPSKVTLTDRLRGGITTAAMSGLGGYILTGNPLTGIAVGVGGFLPGWRWSYLGQLKPASRASEVINSAVLNLEGTLSRAGDDPVLGNKYIHSMANTPVELAAELSMPSIAGADGQIASVAIRSSGAVDMADTQLAKWSSSAWARTMIDNIAKATGQDTAQVLKLLMDAKTGSDVLLRRFVDAASKDNSPEAKAIVESYQAKELTPAKLTEIAKLFTGDNPAPLNLDLYHAQLLTAVSEKMAGWAADTFGVKPDPLWARLGQTVKAAQSLALLGLNPAYLMNNTINNFVVMASQGVFGLRTIKNITGIWEAEGIIPPRLQAGVGPDALGLELDYSPLRSATRADDTLQAITDLSKQGPLRKLAIASRLSDKVEQFSSANSFTSAYLNIKNKLWRAGDGFDRMPPALEGILRNVDPNLPDFIYSAIRGGANQKEVEAALFNTVTQANIDSAISYYSNVSKVDENILRDTLSQSGVYDALQTALETAKTPEDVRRAFGNVDKQMQDWFSSHLTDMAQQQAFKIAAKVHTEGMFGVVQAWDDMLMQVADTHTQHWADLETMWAKANDPANEGIRDQIISEGMAKERLRYDALNRNMSATYKGMFEGLTLESADARSILDAFDNYKEDWARFYREVDKLYGDVRRTKYATKELRESAWTDAREQAFKLYQDAIVKETNTNALMGQRFTDALGKQFGESVKVDAQAWRERMSGHTKERGGMVSRFREATKTMTLQEKNAAWREFINRGYEGITDEGYLPFIKRYLQEEINGAHQLYNKSTGKGQPTIQEAPPQFPEAQPTVVPSAPPTAPEAQTVAPAPEVIPVPTTHPYDAQAVRDVAHANGLATATEAGVPLDKVVVNLVNKYLKFDFTDIRDIDPRMVAAAISAKQLIADAQMKLDLEPLKAEIEAAKLAPAPEVAPVVEPAPAEPAWHGWTLDDKFYKTPFSLLPEAIKSNMLYGLQGMRDIFTSAEAPRSYGLPTGESMGIPSTYPAWYSDSTYLQGIGPAGVADALTYMMNDIEGKLPNDATSIKLRTREYNKKIYRLLKEEAVASAIDSERSMQAEAPVIPVNEPDMLTAWGDKYEALKAELQDPSIDQAWLTERAARLRSLEAQLPDQYHEMFADDLNTLRSSLQRVANAQARIREPNDAVQRQQQIARLTMKAVMADQVMQGQLPAGGYDDMLNSLLDYVYDQGNVVGVEKADFVQMSRAIDRARAASWASRTGQPISEWYKQIAGVTMGGDVVEGLRQGYINDVNLTEARAAYRTMEKHPEWIDAAITEFGLTTNAKEAGYILPDGRMLDFSGKKEGGTPGVRSYDHRDISHAIPDEYLGGGLNQITKFAQHTDSVRFDISGNNMYVSVYSHAPTPEQVAVINKAIKQYRVNDLFWDIQDAYGRNLVSEEITPVNANKIISITSKTEQLFSGRQSLKEVQDLFGQDGTLYQRVNEPTDPVWYSQLRRVVESIPQERMTVGQLRAMAMKGGAKADEMEWTGFKTWLDAQPDSTKVAKADALAAMREVVVEETRLGGGTKTWTQADIDTLEQEARRTRNFAAYEQAVQEYEAQQLGRGGAEIGVTTHYQQYVLPGGENYRELLFRLPGRETKLQYYLAYKDGPSLGSPYATEAEARAAIQETFPGRNDIEVRFKDIGEETRTAPDFRAPHFGNQGTNLLAHVRLDDRVDAQGKRVLFVEEVQSDWHEQGRERGYKKPVDPAVTKKLDQDIHNLQGGLNDMFQAGKQGTQTYIDFNARLNELIAERGKYYDMERMVPPAPFAKTWHELVMKRVLRIAAEEGYDRVAWTTGEQQAARYDLAKQVEVIYWNKAEREGSYDVSVIQPGGNALMDGNTMTPTEMRQYFGADITSRIVNDSRNSGEVRGKELSVGGTGMKGFYDQMLVSWANKYGKKWGASVGETNVETTGKYWLMREGQEYLSFTNKLTAEEAVKNYTEFDKVHGIQYSLKYVGDPTPVHSLDITPAMKDSVMKGQPLFQDAAGKARGALSWGEDGKAIIHAFQLADASTYPHEFGHLFRKDMVSMLDQALPEFRAEIAADITTMNEWTASEIARLNAEATAGTLTTAQRKAFFVDEAGNPTERITAGAGNDWTRAQEEVFARGLEKYLADGIAPTPTLRTVFENFKKWLLRIYTSLKGSEIDLHISESMQQVFDRMLTEASLEAPKPSFTRAGQGVMFGAGEDLPMFSGTAMRGQESTFAPPEVARTDIMPGFEDVYKPQMKGAVQELSVGARVEAPDGMGTIVKQVRGTSDVQLDNGQTRIYNTWLLKGEAPKEGMFAPTQLKPGDKITIPDIQKGDVVYLRWHTGKHAGKEWTVTVRSIDANRIEDTTGLIVKIKDATQADITLRSRKPAEGATPLLQTYLTSHLTDPQFIDYLGAVKRYVGSKDIPLLTRVDFARATIIDEIEYPRRVKLWQTIEKSAPDVANQLDVHIVGTISDWYQTGNGGERILYQTADGTVTQQGDGTTALTPNDGDPVRGAGEVPPGTTDSLQTMPPIWDMQMDGYNRNIKPMMDGLQEYMLNPKNKRASLVGANLDPQAEAQFQDYLQKIWGQMAETKLTSVKYAERQRDLALLNYNKRYGADNLLEMVMPYQFWFTRSALNWALRAIDRPSYLVAYAALKKLQDQVGGANIPGIPTRLRGKMKINLPFIPDWMGGGLYIDPFKQLFPFAQLMQPLEQMRKDTNTIQRRAESIIQTQVGDGDLTEAEASQAISTRKGSVWENAYTQATMDTENDRPDPYEYASLLTGFSLPVQWAYYGLTGQKEKISALPITKTIKAATTALGMNQGRGVNIEDPLRRAVGLPLQMDRFEQYRIERELANMAGDGTISAQDALQAMIDRQGDAYVQAQKRVSQEQSWRTLFSTVAADVFPEGEQEQRALRDKYIAALEAGQAGNKTAVTDFFNQNPEYRARLAMGQDPEQRLRRYLISQIWDKWMTGTPDLYKKQISEKLGSLFQDAFINKETRSYDTIDTPTLTQWAGLLGNKTPEAAGEQAQISIDLAPPEVAQIYQRYHDEKAKLFPNISAIFDQIFALPEGDPQRDALYAMPEMVSYEQWNNEWLASYPQIIPYAIGKDNKLAGVKPEIAAQVYQFRALTGKYFPQLNAIMNVYYAIPAEDTQGRAAWRQQNAQAYGQIKAYYNFKDEYMQKFPQTIPYLYSVEGLANQLFGSNYASSGGGGGSGYSSYAGGGSTSTTTAKKERPYLTQSQIWEFSPPLVRALYGYYYRREQLGEGALMELKRLHDGFGDTRDFNTWLETVVKPSFVTG